MAMAPTLRQALLAAAGALLAAEIAVLFLVLGQTIATGQPHTYSAEWIVSVAWLNLQLVAPVILIYGVGAVWLLGQAQRLSFRSLSTANALAAGLFTYYATFDPETATFGLGGGFFILVLMIVVFAAVLTAAEWIILTRVASRGPRVES
jgi:hypothetical protein